MNENKMQAEKLAWYNVQECSWGREKKNYDDDRERMNGELIRANNEISKLRLEC